MSSAVLRAKSRLSLPEWVFVAIAGAMIVALAVTVVLWALDSRTINGISIWAKPLKFELALAVHSGTLAIVVSRLRPTVRTGAFMQGTAVVFLAACTIEMGWIIFQAAQGQPSHFNNSSDFHSAMFSVMAVAAVFITMTAAAVALAVSRDSSFAAGAPLKFGILVGLNGGAILTLLTAFAIGAMGSPYVAEVPALTSRMTVTGWSLTGGDLRVAHFLATHMMQAVPIAAVLATAARIGHWGRFVVLAFAAVWAVWTMAEFTVALSGAPALFLALCPSSLCG